MEKKLQIKKIVKANLEIIQKNRKNCCSSKREENKKIRK